MKNILAISLRNLFRQKRRNILLTVIIAFGMLVLVMSGATGDGMADIILNKILVNSVGHIQVAGFEILDKNNSIIRDKEKMLEIIGGSLKGVIDIRESIDIRTRAIGNGRGAGINITSVEPSKEFFETLNLESGKPSDFTNDSIENPIILTKQYARKLKVNVNDTVHVSLKTVNGQVETAKLRVTGISRLSTSFFINNSVYIKLADIKRIMGYSDREAAKLIVLLKEPETTRLQAGNLYRALSPRIAYITLSGVFSPLRMFGFKTDSPSMNVLTNGLKLINGSWDNLTRTNEVAIPESLAARESLSAGMMLPFIYRLIGNGEHTNNLKVGGIFRPADKSLDWAVLINQDSFLNIYYKNFPDTGKGNFNGPGDNSPLSNILTREWTLMPRAGNSDEIEKEYDGLLRSGTNGLYIFLTTMYEEGTNVLQWAGLVQSISVISFIILFFITQIGVLNTLRMSIKERTREIGTLRSIGMQKTDIRNLFICETVFLTLFASIMGICLAFAAMRLISLINIETTSGAYSIFILNNHFNFVTPPVKIAAYIIVLLIIAFISAYLPAKKAAALPPSEALRHYE